MDGTIELAPIRRGASHQTDALQVVQCAAAMAIKHVTAAVHLGSVESNFPPVILPIAMEKNVVRSFQAGNGTVQAIMSPSGRRIRSRLPWPERRPTYGNRGGPGAWISGARS